MKFMMHFTDYRLFDDDIGNSESLISKPKAGRRKLGLYFYLIPHEIIYKFYPVKYINYIILPEVSLF